MAIHERNPDAHNSSHSALRTSDPLCSISAHTTAGDGHHCRLPEHGTISTTMYTYVHHGTINNTRLQTRERLAAGSQRHTAVDSQKHTDAGPSGTRMQTPAGTLHWPSHNATAVPQTAAANSWTPHWLSHNAAAVPQTAAAISWCTSVPIQHGTGVFPTLELLDHPPHWDTATVSNACGVG